MAVSRRLFAFGAAGLALAGASAHAAPGDGLIGAWEGRLSPVTGPALISPEYELETLRLIIAEDGARVFLIENGRVTEEVKPGAFRMGRMGANAVIVALDAYAPLGSGWVETWSFAVTLRGENALSVVFTRQVNNMQQDPTDPDAIFSIVHSGEMQRVFPDHV